MKNHPQLRVSLDKFLSLRGISTYKLMKHLKGKVARGTVYAVAAGNIQRIDLETLSGLLGGLSDLTGQPVTPNDLLEVIEVIEEPLEEMDEETKAWLGGAAYAMADRLAEIEKDVPPEELEAWLEAHRKAAKPCAYDTKKRTWLYGNEALEYRQRTAQ